MASGGTAGTSRRTIPGRIRAAWTWRARRWCLPRPRGRFAPTGAARRWFAGGRPRPASGSPTPASTAAKAGQGACPLLSHVEPGRRPDALRGRDVALGCRMAALQAAGSPLFFPSPTLARWIERAGRGSRVSSSGVLAAGSFRQLVQGNELSSFDLVPGLGDLLKERLVVF